MLTLRIASFLGVLHRLGESYSSFLLENLMLISSFSCSFSWESYAFSFSTASSLSNLTGELYSGSFLESLILLRILKGTSYGTLLL